MRLGLLSDKRAGRAELALPRRDRLAGRFAGRARDTRDARRTRRASELLNPRGDLALVLAGLLQVLLQTLLVGRLPSERDMGGEVGLELGFLDVRLTKPLHEFRITLVQIGIVG